MAEKTMLEKIKGAWTHLVVAAIGTVVVIVAQVPLEIVAALIFVGTYGGREHEAEVGKLRDQGMKRKQAEVRAIPMTLIKPDFWMAVIGAGAAVAALRVLS